MHEVRRADSDNQVRTPALEGLDQRGYVPSSAPPRKVNTSESTTTTPSSRPPGVPTRGPGQEGGYGYVPPPPPPRGDGNTTGKKAGS